MAGRIITDLGMRPPKETLPVNLIISVSAYMQQNGNLFIVMSNMSWIVVFAYVGVCKLIVLKYADFKCMTPQYFWPMIKEALR